MGDETARISCEWEDGDVERFVAALRRVEFPAEVDDIRAEHSEPIGEYRRFTIVLGEGAKELLETLSSRIAILGLDTHASRNARAPQDGQGAGRRAGKA